MRSKIAEKIERNCWKCGCEGCSYPFQMKVTCLYQFKKADEIIDLLAKEGYGRMVTPEK